MSGMQNAALHTSAAFHDHMSSQAASAGTVMTVSCRWILVLAAIMAILLPQPGHVLAQTAGQLDEAIDLFDAGRDDAALTVLNEVVDMQPHCPLAYYYAARIRLHKDQLTRAQANLEKAIADSAGFLDAYAYLALTLRDLDKPQEALAAWQQYVDGTGILEDADLSATTSIMTPETYRMRLAAQETARQARIEAERERQRLENIAQAEQEQREAEKRALLDQEQREHERLAREEEARLAAQAAEDSIAALASIPDDQLSQSENSVDTASEDNAVQISEETTAVDDDGNLRFRDTPLGAIDDRISAGFRIGMIGLGVLMGALVLVLGGMYVWIRRRRAPGNDEARFTEQVERLLDDLKFEVDEDRAVRDFEVRRQEIAGEIESLRSSMAPPAETPSARPDLPPEIEASELSKNNGGDEIPSFSATAHPGVFHKPPITEEVKTLVSRLFREGKSPEQIAHISDLTRTEVNLILAVRERRLENTVAEIHQDEVHHEHDRLFDAIVNLQAEGASLREIARQLDLSLSEVELATSIMSLRGRGNH